jgi:hypothetical protein
MLYRLIAICQADLEYAILGDIQDMVTSGFVDGVPPHRRPSAKNIEYDKNASSIFVVESDNFAKLTAAEVQEIFRHRHILVRNSPTVERLDFTLDALERLGSLSMPVCLQGERCPLP